MSIQDDIFDVESYLEENDAVAADLFDGLIRYIGELEGEVEKYRQMEYHLAGLKRLLKDLEDKKS